MDWGRVTWDNTTYYDDDGLQYLIERLYRSINAAAKGTKLRPLPPPGAVRIRYYGGKKGFSAATLKRRVAGGPMELRLRISRRKQLYTSDLEKLAGLTAEEPTIPPAVIVDVCRTILGTRHWQMNRILRALYHRTDYPGKDKEPADHQFPDHAFLHHVNTEILPTVEVPIHATAKKGASKAAKLQNLVDKVERLVEYDRYYVNEIPRVKRELERLLRSSAKNKKELAEAQQVLAAAQEEE